MDAYQIRVKSFSRCFDHEPLSGHTYTRTLVFLFVHTYMHISDRAESFEFSLAITNVPFSYENKWYSENQYIKHVFLLQDLVCPWSAIARPLTGRAYLRGGHLILQLSVGLLEVRDDLILRLVDDLEFLLCLAPFILLMLQLERMIN